MYILHLFPLGEVRLYLSTILIYGFNIYISGYDEHHNRIDFTMDRMHYPEDYPNVMGYCHIISYIKNGITTKCNTYASLG